MRRSDREIKDFDGIVSALEKCDAVRLAFNDGDIPYIVPLSFGIERNGDSLTLYFHGAPEGKKIDLIRREGRAAFEADCSHRLFFDREKGSCTTEYESVVGYGDVGFVTSEEEKIRALKILMKHYGEEDFPFSLAVVPGTAVFRLDVRSVTGKRRIKREKS